MKIQQTMVAGAAGRGLSGGNKFRMKLRMGFETPADAVGKMAADGSADIMGSATAPKCGQLRSCLNWLHTCNCRAGAIGVAVLVVFKRLRAMDSLNHKSFLFGHQTGLGQLIVDFLGAEIDHVFGNFVGLEPRAG